MPEKDRRHCIAHWAILLRFRDYWTKIRLKYYTVIGMDVRKAILIFVGTVCVGLGVLGMFLQLLPTTVFLLMAAYCYSRSSERFHTWLLNNKLCGKYIRNYKSGEGISIRQKITTITILWASIGFSIWMVSTGFWVTLLLLLIATGVTLHMALLKTYRAESHSAQERLISDQS